MLSILVIFGNIDLQTSCEPRKLVEHSGRSVSHDPPDRVIGNRKQDSDDHYIWKHVVSGRVTREEENSHHYHEDQEEDEHDGCPSQSNEMSGTGGRDPCDSFS